jgi:predicted XRE-type DNA-binding protein
MTVEHTTPPGGNVFEDLGFGPEEAENLMIRARLMDAIEDLIASRGLTQQQAAELLGTTQPRISDLVRGKINEFTIDSLVRMLSHAGFRVEVRVNGPAAESRDSGAA